MPLHPSSGRLASVLKVGLTGGIACGKSQFLREFHKLGVYTIDADEIAHRAILPDTSAYQEILDHFGKEILAPDEAEFAPGIIEVIEVNVRLSTRSHQAIAGPRAARRFSTMPALPSISHATGKSTVWLHALRPNRRSLQVGLSSTDIQDSSPGALASPRTTYS